MKEGVNPQLLVLWQLEIISMENLFRFRKGSSLTTTSLSLIKMFLFLSDFYLFDGLNIF